MGLAGLATQIAVFGAIMLAVAWLLRRWDPAFSWTAGVVGLGALAAGVYLSVAPPAVDPAHRDLVAPGGFVAPTPLVSTAMGQPIETAPGSAAAAATAGDRVIVVCVTPDRFERRGHPNQVIAEVHGGPDLAGAPVRYVFTVGGHPMEPDEGEALPLGAGRYEVPSAVRFDMGGYVRLDLTVDADVLTYWVFVVPDVSIAFVAP